MKTVVQSIPNPSRRDSFVYASYLGKLGLAAMKNTAESLRKRGPAEMMQDYERYPWLRTLFNFKGYYDSLTIGRTGLYREACALVLLESSKNFNDMMNGFINSPGQTVIHEDAVSPEILYGMGLKPWVAEFAGMLVPVYDSKMAEDYIDAAENEGIPPDVCSMTKITMGMVLEDHLPHPIVMVTSNNPCDGGMSQYALIQREYQVPTFRLDIPFEFYNDRAVAYFVDQLKRMIAWLEKHTPGRMDWDLLREICEQRNRAYEYELDLWDLLRHRPAPMAAEIMFMSHIAYLSMPGSPRGEALVKQLVAMARENRNRGQGALTDERYRMTLWNPMPVVFTDMFAWAEQTYGVALIMDMLSFNRNPFIDTRSPETMLRDLAKITMQMPMARNTHGPAEYYFSDLFYLYEYFDLDMVWIPGHVGCKNTQALYGMLREKCRERDIPLLIMDMDLVDSRIVSPEGIRRQIEQFMETVMKAERLM